MNLDNYLTEASKEITGLYTIVVKDGNTERRFTFQSHKINSLKKELSKRYGTKIVTKIASALRKAETKGTLKYFAKDDAVDFEISSDGEKVTAIFKEAVDEAYKHDGFPTYYVYTEQDGKKKHIKSYCHKGLPGVDVSIDQASLESCERFIYEYKGGSKKNLKIERVYTEPDGTKTTKQIPVDYKKIEARMKEEKKKDRKVEYALRMKQVREYRDKADEIESKLDELKGEEKKKAKKEMDKFRRWADEVEDPLGLKKKKKKNEDEDMDLDKLINEANIEIKDKNASFITVNGQPFKGTLGDLKAKFPKHFAALKAKLKADGKTLANFGGNDPAVDIVAKADGTIAVNYDA